MCDIPFHINQFIYLIKRERPLKHPIKEHTLLYLLINLMEVEHPLKTSNKRTHV